MRRPLRCSRAPTATRTPRTCRCAAHCRIATGSPPERIALGNGSCDILLAAGEALLEPGAEVVYAWPAFSVYPHLAAASGARAIEVPLDDDDRHDLDAIAAEITVATRLVLICNPNNPTSTSVGLDRIEEFLDGVTKPRVRDPRRGLLRVRAAPRRHVRLGGAAAALSEPGPAADVLEGLRAGGAARRLRAVRRRSHSARPSTSCASRSTSTPPPRPPRSRRSGTRTSVEERVTQTIAAPARPRGGDPRARSVGRSVRRELHLAAPARGLRRADAGRRPARPRRAGPRRRVAGARAARCGSRSGRGPENSDSSAH